MTGNRRILCVYHATQREDRVSRLLAARGFELEWVNPARGEILPEDLERYLGVVVYGGEQSVNDETEAMAAEQRWIARWVAEDRPYLGLCLGAQLLARALGADVRRHRDRLLESGYTRIHPEPGPDPLFNAPMYVFQWHNEGFDVPRGCERLARGARFDNQAFRRAAHIVGLQFHPEVTSAIMIQWFREGGHMLTDPGAQNAEAQLRDARVFEPVIESWTGAFLDRWVASSIESLNLPRASHA
ncbi:MAG: glutamine amidotransferase [Proteobacteria bacterium]|nr:MAG: glutamine amidotransferase [Pseudomonadota bacterium]